MFSAGSISSEEIIKYAHRISASNAVCAPLNWVPGMCQALCISHWVLVKVHVQLHSLLSYLTGDPRRPYPTDLEMRSGMLGHMANLSTNGVNGHLPGDALAAGRLPGKFSWALKGRSTHASWQRDFRWGQRFVTVISKCIIYQFIIIHPYPSFKKLKDGSIIFLFIKYKHWTQVLFVAIQTAPTSSSVT